MVFRYFAIFLLFIFWVGLFSILPSIIFFTDFQTYVYAFYLFISVVLLILSITNQIEQRVIQEKFHVNYLAFCALWYAFVFSLPFLPLIEDWMNRKPKPTFETLEEIDNFFSRVSKNREELQRAYKNFETLDEKQQARQYISEIKPLTSGAFVLRKKAEQFRGYDYSEIEGLNWNEFERLFEYLSVDYVYLITDENHVRRVRGVAGLLAEPQSTVDERLSEGDGPIIMYSLLGGEKSEWDIFRTPSFKKSLKKISKNLIEQLEECLEEIILDPRKSLPPKIEPLTGNKKGLWRYKLGEYRILYEPDLDTRLLTFIAIGTRQNFYKTR